MAVIKARDLVEDTWFNSEQAADYIGVNYSHFRSVMIQRIVDSGVDGVGRVGSGRKSPWRFKKSALDDFLRLNAGGGKDVRGA